MNASRQRLVPLVFACLTAFLFLFPLGVGKPGMPLTFKADEPSYYLMALSLTHDGDLECNVEDRRRAVNDFPFLPIDNTIVMTDDGWRTTYFGKPYLYSMLAAPLAHFFGADGMVAFNVLLFAAMIWMGTCYLRRFNGEGLAALFSTGFFVVSGLFPYVFWMHPEVFMAFGVCVGLYFGLTSAPSRPSWGGLWSRMLAAVAHPVVRLSLSAAGIAAATYHKPMMAIMGVPVVWALLSRRNWRQLVCWLLAAAISMGIFAGLAVALTGHPSAYLGVQRTGFRITDPEVEPLQVQSEEVLEDLKTDKSWSWLWRLPEFKAKKTLSSLGSFLWGRHTGFVVYLPFAVLAIILFLVHGLRDSTRWSVLAAAAGLAAFYLVWIPFNWHGGAGFVGNRYFVSAYPAFLFLVTQIRPRWALLPGFAAGGLLLGVLVFQPLGSPVREATLQSHVRGPAYRLFPVEKTIQSAIPGYRGVTVDRVWFRGRKDAMTVAGDEMIFYGNLAAEVWMVNRAPILEPVLFEVRSLAAENEVTLSIGDEEVTVLFTPEDRSDDVQIVELTPSNPEPYRPVHIVPDDKPASALYHLTVTPARGVVPRGRDGQLQWRSYFGAGVRYLGPRSKVYSDDAFTVEWLSCEAPAIVTAGDKFRAEAHVRNLGVIEWPAHGLTRVTLSYHWVRDGEVTHFEGIRTRLPGNAKVGDRTGALLQVEAPTEPGTYTLQFDIVREGVAWFSNRNGETLCEATVEVVPPA